MNNAVKVTLECEHVLWFQTPVPRPGDDIWCGKCGIYEQVYPAHASVMTVHVDDMKSTPIRDGRYKGECTYTEDEGETECGASETDVNWQNLRAKMHSHYMRTHTRFGATLTLQTIDVPSTPPF